MSQQPYSTRLAQFAHQIDQDPGNLRLLEDACFEANSAEQLDLAELWLVAYRAQASLPASLKALSALIAMRRGRFAQGATCLEAMAAETPLDPVLRFNLAYCLAATRRSEEALKQLDVEVLLTVDAAPALRVRTLHALGRLEEALECGTRYLTFRKTDAELSAALSVVSLDRQDWDGARLHAAAASNTSEGLTTEAALLLREGNSGDAREMFQRALGCNPSSARAKLGIGLTELICGDLQSASRDLEAAAQSFEHHVGSWVAAGWAHVMTGDVDAAERCFTKACEIEPRFAEAQGGLALVAFCRGNLDRARRLADRASRLDSNCLAATRVRIGILEAEGNPLAAQQLLATALLTKIDESGTSLKEAVAKLAMNGGRTRF